MSPSGLKAVADIWKFQNHFQLIMNLSISRSTYSRSATSTLHFGSLSIQQHLIRQVLEVLDSLKRTWIRSN
ncbi:hypothetical protein FGO68_gene13536 [Halteria grandinella]|uniref:Uncharacterized protein n=1 Tax=Halteria grandinella TaxID=5974 RepID=A0A8J8NR46_HALGN|nr:hypothetical protein FGO68_gene13536 [Halteria grandinella]